MGHCQSKRKTLEERYESIRFIILVHNNSRNINLIILFTQNHDAIILTNQKSFIYVKISIKEFFIKRLFFAPLTDTR